MSLYDNSETSTAEIKSEPRYCEGSTIKQVTYASLYGLTRIFVTANRAVISALKKAKQQIKAQQISSKERKEARDKDSCKKVVKKTEKHKAKSSGRKKSTPIQKLQKYEGLERSSYHTSERPSRCRLYINEKSKGLYYGICSECTKQTPINVIKIR
ncbi:uncharacterized protein LOC113233843 [Hyposmocoma kahamanoa]|uniref:uncharacterized protein LOC113233843 n=1 Tax=Hyposmocoma kahamanoa TaxID=1477025 RepID=UPI000E6D8406|nr:uncharacterized protein LOC113233843 [Hyposmocoma kahamanoa]